MEAVRSGRFIFSPNQSLATSHWGRCVSPSEGVGAEGGEWVSVGRLVLRSGISYVIYIAHTYDEFIVYDV